MTFSTRSILLGALIAAAAAAPLRAQSVSFVPTPAPAAEDHSTAARGSAITVAAGPTQAATSVALRAPVVADESAVSAAAVQGRGFDRSEALMIVGGAMLLAGAIIGGDAGTIVMVGGAAVGIYGLYLWLQ